MNLTLALLVCLERVHPLMAREELLRLEVNCLLPAPATLTEVTQLLRELERRQWAVAARAQLGYTLWKITAHGRAALAEIERGM